MHTFAEWTLASLDKTFKLNPTQDSPMLADWLTAPIELTSFEQNVLRTLQAQLRLNVHDWNETELAYNFIGPVLAFVQFTDSRFNFFAERPFAGTVDGIELRGRPDGLIASGFREPESPYFCLHEYKRETDPTMATQRPKRWPRCW